MISPKIKFCLIYPDQDLVFCYNNKEKKGSREVKPEDLEKRDRNGVGRSESTGERKPTGDTER